MAERLRVLKDAAEIARVPVTEPVLIEIPPDVSGTETVETARQTPEVRADETPADDASKLHEQLEAMKLADKTRQDEIEKANKDRKDALALADKRQQELTKANQDREQSEHDLIAGSLSGSQAELTAAENEYAKAAAEGDFAAQARANSKIARASQKILYYEQATADVALRKERGETVSRETPAQQPSDPAQVIDMLPNLMPKEREWLKSHPEVMMDPALNQELGVGYRRALKAGHIRGTDDYLSFLDDFMGYKAKPNGNGTTHNIDEEPRETIMAAPVTRENVSPSGNRAPSTSQVTLSPEQREIARNMGISEVNYAKGVLAGIKEKRDNPEKYSRDR